VGVDIRDNPSLIGSLQIDAYLVEIANNTIRNSPKQNLTSALRLRGGAIDVTNNLIDAAGSICMELVSASNVNIAQNDCYGIGGTVARPAIGYSVTPSPDLNSLSIQDNRIAIDSGASMFDTIDCGGMSDSTVIGNEINGGTSDGIAIDGCHDVRDNDLVDILGTGIRLGPWAYNPRAIEN
jgi:hypothetical protein